jgi:predicted ribosome quality control (RQC) complex YloA/Tae2 family protein
MAFDGILLSALKDNLQAKIIGARIEKVYQIEQKQLIVRLRQQNKNLQLLISTDAEGARINLTNLDYEFPAYPPDFCMLLRKYLKNSYITKIIQPEFERIIEINIEKRGKEYKLIAELMGKYSNVILLDDKEIVLDAMKRITNKQSSERELYPGVNYHYPPGQQKINPLVPQNKFDFLTAIPDDFNQASFRAVMFNFRGIGPYSAREIVHRAGIESGLNYQDLSRADKESLAKSFFNLTTLIKQQEYQAIIGLTDHKLDYISAFPLNYRKVTESKRFTDFDEMMDYYYKNFLKNKKLNHSIREVNKVVNNYLQKNIKKQEKLKQQLADSKNAEKYKKYGELITANIYQIKKGSNEVEVTDYYSSDQSKLKIKLRPDLTASENAQKYFKKYNKLKKSVKHLKREIAKLRHEEKYLNQVSLNIEQAETLNDLDEIKDELKDEGYIKKQQKKNRKKQTARLKPRKFISSDGYQILVGRNNRQNDQLTKKIANQGDLWLHTKTIAGSHVIIKRDTAKDVPEQTINEAAVLAAYYSKARQSKNVPIDYTQVENVNKPKGAKPGLVYYDNYQTIYIDPDLEVIKKMTAD